MSTPEPTPASTQGLVDLLEVLVPTTTVVVQDNAGNAFDLPASLSARRQILVMRRVKEIKDVVLDDDALGSLMAGAGGEEGGAALVSVVLDLATNDAVLDALAGAFEVAHPEVVAKSREVQGGKPTDDAADLFPLEAIIEGLVPFFARLARKAATAMGAVSAAVKTLPAA